VIDQANRTIANWIIFHNTFTKNNLSHILSLREAEIAMLAARRVPYAKIARQFALSVGSVKNIMQVIYEKTFVNNRRELSRIVL
jgi:DNA-binding CsgD family transcriptional regulator